MPRQARACNPVRIHLRLFAVCRERAGSDHLDLHFEGETVNVQTLKEVVAAQVPVLAPILPSVRVAVNQRFAEPDDVVGPEDELALIPPVSGGAGPIVALRDRPLDVPALERAVHGGDAGALLSFQGTVRNRTGAHDVTHLEYEAYPEMAEAFLRTIAEEAEAKWPGARVGVEHRTGRLAVGEVSVAIVVAHPHRAEAFEACRHVIERLKEDVPIWKKEIRGDGSVWVGVGS